MNRTTMTDYKSTSLLLSLSILIVIIGYSLVHSSELLEAKTVSATSIQYVQGSMIASAKCVRRKNGSETLVKNRNNELGGCGPTTSGDWQGSGSSWSHISHRSANNAVGSPDNKIAIADQNSTNTDWVELRFKRPFYLKSSSTIQAVLGPKPNHPAINNYPVGTSYSISCLGLDGVWRGGSQDCAWRIRNNYANPNFVGRVRKM